MLNRSASLAKSTSVFKALPGKLDIKRHSPSILYLSVTFCPFRIALYERLFSAKKKAIHWNVDIQWHSVSICYSVTSDQ